MLPSVRTLAKLGYKLYASSGTADFYLHHGIMVETIDWAYENIGDFTTDTKGQFNNMADFLAHKHLDLVINLPIRHGGARRVSSFNTHGNGAEKTNERTHQNRGQNQKDHNRSVDGTIETCVPCIVESEKKNEIFHDKIK